MIVLIAFLAAGALLLAITHFTVRRLSAAAALVLLLLPFAFAGKALLLGRVYAPVDASFAVKPLASVAAQNGVTSIRNRATTDIYLELIPWRQVARESWRRGEWPLWNPYAFAGAPLAGASQASAYHPFVLASVPLPDDLAVTFLAAMTYLLAAVSMFVFLRDLECSENGSLIGAAAWMLSNFVVFFLETPLGLGVAVFPLVVLGARRVVRAPSIRSWLLLTSAFVLTLLAGHPETALQAILLAALWSLAEICFGHRRNLTGTLAAGLLAGAMALAICAIHLLPFLDAVTQTHEFVDRTVLRDSLEQPRSWSSAAEQFGASFVPVLFGRPTKEMAELPQATRVYATGYIGSVAFALALCGVVLSRRRSRLVLLAVAAGSLLVAVNVPGLSSLYLGIPLVNVTIAERLFFGAAFAFAALAGLGAEAIQARPRGGRFVLIAVVAAIVISTAALFPLLTGFHLSRQFILVQTMLAIVPLVGCIALSGRNRTLLVSLLLLLVAQRIAEWGDFYPSLERRAFYPDIAILGKIPARSDPFRIVATGSIVLPNLATHYHLEDARGFDAMTSVPFLETYPLWCTHQSVWFNRVDDLNERFLSALNVRYALTDVGSPIPEGWSEVATANDVKLLENLHVLPRAFIPRRLHRGVASNAEVSDMYLSMPDYGEDAWIRDERIDAPRIDANGAGTISVVSAHGGYELTANLESAASIVISETAWRGWKAFENDRPLAVRVADHALLAVELPPGHHVVALRYVPDSFRTGRAITFGALLAVPMVVFASARRRRLE